MQLNPYNLNQTLYNDSHFLGLPVYLNRGPLVAEYLESAHRVMRQALDQYPRGTAIRFELRYPIEMNAWQEVTSNEAISRFIDSLKAKIKHNRKKAKERNPYAHDSVVRYIWARESGNDGRVHYHGVVLLNGDAYFTLGQFDSDAPNMVNRLKEAWASALNMTLDQTAGLVNIPDNALYRFDRASSEELASFFYRVSYLCKADTKHFGHGHHGFGTSHR